MDIERYWRAVLRQDAAELRGFFHPDAMVRWHNSNECFTVEEFIRANCEYPGQWDGVVERIEWAGGLVITATHVYTRDGALSFHVVSFIELRDGLIFAVDEYWGDDGPAPQWRLDKEIGRPIV